MKHIKSLQRIEERNPLDLEQSDLLSTFYTQSAYQDLYIKAVGVHGMLELPVITEENKVLRHFDDVIAARELGVSAMEVVVLPEDFSRFYALVMGSNIFRSKDHAAMIGTMEFLETYRETADGLAEEEELGLPKDKEDRYSMILGHSTGTIKGLLRYGREFPDEVNLVQQGMMTWRELKEKARKARARPAEPAQAPKNPVVEFGESVTYQNAAPDTEQPVGGEDYDDPNREPDPLTWASLGDDEDKADVKTTNEGHELLIAEDDAQEANPDPDDGNVQGYEITHLRMVLKDGRVVTMADQEIRMDGRPVAGTSYEYQSDLGLEDRTEYHSTIVIKGLNGDCSMQIIFDNPRKFFY